MPNERLCELAVVLDRSGSMHDIQSDMIGGFAAFIAEQRKEPSPCVVSLYQFDNAFDVVYEERPLSEVPPLVLIPRGNTALLDAMGRTITMVGERLAAKPEPERPGMVVILVITDGHENASKDWSRAKLNAAVLHQREAYKWQFAFLGANMDAFAEAASLGVAQSAAMVFNASPSGVRKMYGAASKGTRAYRSGAGGQSLSFSPEDEEEKSP